MWFVLMAVLGLLALASVFYLLRCFHRFPVLKRLEERNRLLSWVLAALPVAALGLFACINVTALIVVLLHLVLAFLLCALAFRLLRRVTGRTLSYTAQGCAALLLTLVYLGVGWYQAHHVWETDYEIRSEKQLTAPLRVVEIADSHLGITLDGAGFAREMERIQAVKPDVVVLVGDFVDDDSSREDMVEACRALGALHPTYGVYFAYGNHDEGYFQYRNFSGAELREELEKNGVTILTDESVPIGESYTLVGRRDRSMADRASAGELLEGLDSSRFLILLDHQPNDYAAEAAAGADLVLSGHTHGGHIFPAGQIGLLIGANDKTYGLEQRGSTFFLVTSGLSGWAIPFKTGCRSEFAVVDILPPA